MRFRGKSSHFVIVNLTLFLIIYMYNPGNPTRNEVGFKITSYILVLLTKTNKKLSSHGSSYNCMKI